MNFRFCGLQADVDATKERRGEWSKKDWKGCARNVMN
jgi:hypothetical protein